MRPRRGAFPPYDARAADDTAAARPDKPGTHGRLKETALPCYNKKARQNLSLPGTKGGFQMDPQSLSGRYRIRPLEEEDIEAVLALCAGNPLFFEYHSPLATRQSILADMAALPPDKAAADKFYLGFFLPDRPEGPPRLAAQLDLVLDYPRPGAAFIGMFMVDGRLQGRGVGSAIIADCAAALAAQGLDTIRLAVDEGNPQSAAFWAKNGFAPTGERIPCAHGAYLPMERGLAVPSTAG